MAILVAYGATAGIRFISTGAPSMICRAPKHRLEVEQCLRLDDHTEIDSCKHSSSGEEEVNRSSTLSGSGQTLCIQT